MRDYHSVIIILVLLTGCDSRLGEDRNFTEGPDADTSGNYFGRGVSREFGRPLLKTLYDTLNNPRTTAEIEKANCDRPLPQHVFSVTLWEEGEYRERQVRLQMTPRAYQNDECLAEAINYVFQHKVKSLDPGPPIDYKYRRSTGAPVDTSEAAKWLPPPPSCPCGK